MSVQSEFNKYSKSYGSHRIVQDLACKQIHGLLPLNEYNTILELGCGGGEFFTILNKKFEKYYAIDFSEHMCDLHPRDTNIEVFCMDFDSADFEHFLQNQKRFDLILAPSSLQWSKNFRKIIELCSLHSNNFACSIFTANTFATLNQIANKNSPLQESHYYLNTASQYFSNLEWEIKNYIINFDNKKEMFDYIKKSGVSGADVKLNFKDAKYLYENYPLNYLEFEVIFISSFSI